MSSSKVHPEDNFFVIPGKPGGASAIPVWKQQELLHDPTFRDISEKVKDLAESGKSKGRSAAAPWSAKHGYELSIKEEAAILKANTRAAAADAAKAQAQADMANKKSKQTPVKQKFVCIVM